MPTRQMLINHVPDQECRIAIVENGRLEELYQERASTGSLVGNIYKGRVVNVEPSIQAAFIDFGLARNGFLHISDLHPKYFPGLSKDEKEAVGQKTPRRDRPPIQKCLRRGQDILVQVLKDGINSKGPTLTSYLSIPGRFLVMMPDMERLGVSRKIEDDETRRTMRKTLDELAPPAGYGFIIRTAGIGRTKTDLRRDLAYLARLWKTIDRRMKETHGVGDLYTESDLLIRTIRDVFTSDIDRIIVDEVSAARRAQDFLNIASPRAASQVLVYHDEVPLFHRYGLEQQIQHINARVVPLPSGGSLVIDSTEALVAIDVNSGKSRESRDAETTAYATNLEAADEICRQLRLRDLGGVIVNDLIDMRPMKHRREIEQRFRGNLKNDRARTQVTAISTFGILEMTRQRMRPSLKRSVYTDCPACLGNGQVMSPESVVLDVMRRLALALHHERVTNVELTISPDVAFHLLNRKRATLAALEQRSGKTVTVRVGGQSLDYVQLLAADRQGNPVEAETLILRNEPELIPVAKFTKQTRPHTATPSDSPTPDRPAQDKEPQDLAGEPPPADDQPTDEGQAAEAQPQAPTDRPRPRRRGRRRRGKTTSTVEAETSPTPSASSKPPTPANPIPHPPKPSPDAATPQKPPTAKNPRAAAPSAPAPPPESASPPEPALSGADSSDDGNGKRPGPSRRRRRRGGRGKKTTATAAAEPGSPETAEPPKNSQPLSPRVPPSPSSPPKTLPKPRSVLAVTVKPPLRQPAPKTDRTPASSTTHPSDTPAPAPTPGATKP